MANSVLNYFWTVSPKEYRLDDPSTLLVPVRELPDLNLLAANDLGKIISVFKLFYDQNVSKKENIKLIQSAWYEIESNYYEAVHDSISDLNLKATSQCIMGLNIFNGQILPDNSNLKENVTLMLLMQANIQLDGAKLSDISALTSALIIAYPILKDFKQYPVKDLQYKLLDKTYDIFQENAGDLYSFHFTNTLSMCGSYGVLPTMEQACALVIVAERNIQQFIPANALLSIESIQKLGRKFEETGFESILPLLIKKADHEIMRVFEKSPKEGQQLADRANAIFFTPK